MREAERTSTDLGVRSHVAAILEVLGPLDGLDVLDVGCGEGQNARAMAAAGARVRGFDPFMEPGEWCAEGRGSYRIERATADALPVADASVDVVLFCFSLHHVSKAKLAPALAEARRVLKPAGRLIVVEPLAEGPSHYVSSPFHDETAVRADAAAAVASESAPRFGRHQRLGYIEQRRWPSFDAYAERMIANMRFNGYTEDAVLAPEVRRRFEQMFAAGNGVFDQPVRIDLFTAPR